MDDAEGALVLKFSRLVQSKEKILKEFYFCLCKYLVVSGLAKSISFPEVIHATIVMSTTLKKHLEHPKHLRVV